MAKRCCRIYDFLIIDATAPFLFAHKENALLRFYKYNKYTKHNSIPTKHLKIMFFDKVH